MVVYQNEVLFKKYSKYIISDYLIEATSFNIFFSSLQLFFLFLNKGIIIWYLKWNVSQNGANNNWRFISSYILCDHMLIRIVFNKI